MSEAPIGEMESLPDEISLPRSALLALAEVPGLVCGPLSPLSRMSRGDGQGRRDHLISALGRMRGPWEWSLPALIDPRLTVGILLGDCETSLLGQYIWPDPAGRGPGFRGHVAPDAFKLAGPVTVEGVQQTLLDFLALGSVGEVEPLRLTLESEQLWLLSAIADAYRSSSLRRRLAREGGRPMGLTAKEVAAAWEIGLASPNPGWSVSLFALLVPTLVPQGFQARVPDLLVSFARAGLLEPLGGNGADAKDEVYMFGESIERLCRGMAGATIDFGLTVQRQQDARIETTIIGGWRTAGGVAVIDLSSLEQGRVELLLAGPHFVVELLDSVLRPAAGGDDGPREAFTMETPFSPEAILAKLRSLPPEQPAASSPETLPESAVQQSTCRSCGAVLKAGARFCASCGATVATVEAPQAIVCPRCRARNQPGARFCRECGSSLTPKGE